jgi:hypothetical protein
MTKLASAKNRINAVRTNDRFQAVSSLVLVVAGSVAATAIVSKLETEEEN